jgi:hypothetical protein
MEFQEWEDEFFINVDANLKPLYIGTRVACDLGFTGTIVGKGCGDGVKVSLDEAPYALPVELIADEVQVI